MNSSQSRHNNAVAQTFPSSAYAISIYHSCLCYFKWKVHSFRDKITLFACAPQKSSLEMKSRALSRWANVFSHISLQIYHNHSFICLYAKIINPLKVFMANTMVHLAAWGGNWALSSFDGRATSPWENWNSRDGESPVESPRDCSARSFKHLGCFWHSLSVFPLTIPHCWQWRLLVHRSRQLRGG
jgi:hypothetical protein